MTTLQELRKQLEAVDNELYRAWASEREAVRRQIADLAVEFQISPETLTRDVAAAFRRAPAPKAVFRAPQIDIPLRGHATSRHVEPRYKNPHSGETWSGRGSMPRWLKSAIAGGALQDDFLIREAVVAEPATADPLREFQDAAKRNRLARQGAVQQA